MVVETHRLEYSVWYTCRQRLTYTPCSTLLAASWRRLHKTTSPGTCTGATQVKALGSLDYKTLGTAIEAECPTNKQTRGLYICWIERAY